MKEMSHIICGGKTASEVLVSVRGYACICDLDDIIQDFKIGSMSSSGGKSRI